MTEPTRYDAVDDRLQECQRGAAVKYKDWKVTDDALRSRLDKLALGKNDMLVMRVSPDYTHDQACNMAKAVAVHAGRQVLVMSVDAQVESLSPELSEDELRELAAHVFEDGTEGVTVGAFRAIVRRVMRMRMGG